MERQGYSGWLEKREEHRQLLFGDSVEVAPVMESVATAPLATLTFNTLKGSYMSFAERFAQTEMADATYNILVYHNGMAEEHSDALFGIAQEEDLVYVAAITAGVISRWERACTRQGRESPFADLVVEDIVKADFERDDVRLVVETASAVMEVIHMGYRVGNDLDSKPAKQLINLVARRGPVFAAAWIRGDIVRDYCESQGKDFESFFDILTPARLAYYAINYPRDPLRQFVAFVERFNTVMSLENLAVELGWDMQKTAAIFTRNTRREVAKLWPKDPLVGARRIASNIDTVLATDNIANLLGVSHEYADQLFCSADRVRLAMKKDAIAKIRRMAAHFEKLTTDNLAMELGWSEAEVDELFTVGYRRRLAAGDDLMTRVHQAAYAFKETLSLTNIARRLNWTEEQAAQVFSTTTRRYFAMVGPGRAAHKIELVGAIRADLLQNFDLPLEVLNYISCRNRNSKKAHAVASKVQDELTRCPPNTGRNTWMWTIALRPNASRETWLRCAAAYRFFLQITHPLSLNDPRADGRRLEDYTSNQDSDFAEGIFSEEPSVYLQELAVKAGVSYDEIRRLMTYFSETEEEDALSVDDKAALIKLRTSLSN